MRRVRIISKESPEPLRPYPFALGTASILLFGIAFIGGPSTAADPGWPWFYAQLIVALICGIVSIIIRLIVWRRRETRKIADHESEGFGVVREDGSSNEGN